MEDLDTLIVTIRRHYPDADLGLVTDAFAFAREAHAEQRRLSGMPYFSHVHGVAVILAEWEMPPAVVAAGILHDIPEETPRTTDDIRARFGPEVASIVAGETKLSKLKYRGVERYAENLRKMFVALAENHHTIIVKFADRLHNLRDLTVFPLEKQRRIARETIEIYSSIANRLGMYRVKAQLEDGAFPYLHPEEASWVESLVAEREHTNREVCAAFQQLVLTELTAHHIPAIAIIGRTKSRYRLYQKLLVHERDISRIYDLVGIRIIVGSTIDCYTALSAIHERWQPVKGRIRDYIANSKPNGYQSLHTTVTADLGEFVELQIRTRTMHEEAEWGAAASWRYHEPGTAHARPGQFRWVEELIRWQHSIGDPKEFIDRLREEILRERILVFTPKGDVIELPEGATPIDFAYAVHTDVGHHAVGALVNDASAPYPLDRPLRHSDVVEILINPKRKSPNPDWIASARTGYAREKIREAIRSDARVKTVS